jgi:O-antigen/teichoic acid export membrane protein
MPTAARAHDRHFSTDHLKSDLKGRSVRAGAITIVTQFGRFALNTGTTMVLARLLEPSDFGLVAMLFAIIMFFDAFRDMGLSAATIQRADINHDQVSTLFWLNVLFSAIVSGFIFAMAPVLAWFYGKPELVNIARVMAGMFLVGGLNAQHSALLTRQMRFRALALITLVSMIVGSAGSIAAAYAGWGYWAIVAQYLLLAVGMTAGMWIASGWVPGLPRRRCGVKPMLAYGFNAAMFQFVNSFARSMDTVLIGRALGSATVGLYSKAYQLVLMPILQINTPLGRVAMPALSRLQDNPVQYRRFYIKAVGITTFLGMPCVAFLFVAADATIDLLLGHKWVDAVPLFRILGPAAFFGTFNVGTAWVYSSLGHTNRQLRWGVVTSTVAVTAFLLALPYGAQGVAAAFSIVYCGLTVGPPGFWYCFRGTFLRLGDVWEAIWRPATASIAAGVVTYALTRSALTIPAEPVPALLIQGAIYTAAYLLCWTLLPGGRRRLADVFGLYKSFRAGKGRVDLGDDQPTATTRPDAPTTTPASPATDATAPVVPDVLRSAVTA